MLSVRSAARIRRQRFLISASLVWFASIGALSPAHAQSKPVADSQPTTQPVKLTAEDEPLRSPRGTVEFFLRAMTAADTKPERIRDGVRCLDLSDLKAADDKSAEQLAPIRANQLEVIIDAMLNDFGLSMDDIPTTSKDKIVTISTKNGLRLALVRNTEGLWQFSAATVAAIPDLQQTVKERQKADSDTDTPATTDTAVPPEFRTARATMKTFLQAMEVGDKAKAATCLDLSDLPEATRAADGAQLADRLKFVMDRIDLVVFQMIPDKPDGEPFPWYIGENGRIELARVDREDSKQKGYWLFTAATVRSIPALEKAFQNAPRIEGVTGTGFFTNPRLWVLEKIPPSLKSEAFFLQIWQWISLGMLMLVGWLVSRIVVFVTSAVGTRIARIESIHIDREDAKKVYRWLGVFVMVLAWVIGLQVLILPSEFLRLIWPALNFVLTVAGVLVAYRLIDLICGVLARRAARTAGRLDDVLIPLVRKVTKIIVLAIGFVFILQALGVHQDTVNKMFAGLGIGGLAFALAAQDSLRNFFGSVTVVLDRPFQVGDWIKVGEVEGTVESVGLRSSRVRTFYNSQVTLPNSELVSAVVDNMGRRQYRRIRTMISVTYSTTPDQLDAFCEGIRELIRRHPYTRKDYYLVWVNEFAASSINILLYCFHRTPDWTTELRERHRLFLDIMRLAKALGVDFAFPTQTIHIARDAVEPGEKPAPQPAAGPASGVSAEGNAEKAGRTAAKAIVRESLGDMEALPPPFVFPSIDDEDDD